MAASQGDGPGPGRLLRAAVFVGSVLALVALALLPLLTPFFIHPALDAAGSATLLGVEAQVAHALSDRSVEDLFVGSAAFDLVGPDGTPFFDEAERGHLRDARLLLWACLALGGLSIAGIAVVLVRSHGVRRSRLWRVVSNAGASTTIAVVVLGLVSLVAFAPLFTLFHQLFFPGGNWSFDPATQRLVQLYPFTFWQIAAAALGILLFVLGGAIWWLGRRLARPPAPTRSPDDR